MALPQGPNQRWSLDFLSDAFSDGRRFRILAIVDDFTRECLALIPDTSLPGRRVTRELDMLIASRGRPAMCVSDNGTELTGMAILRWSQETRVEWHYIAPGKPQKAKPAPIADRQTSALVQTTSRLNVELRHCSRHGSSPTGRDAPVDRTAEIQTKYISRYGLSDADRHS